MKHKIKSTEKIKYIEKFGWKYLSSNKRTFSWKGSDSDMQFVDSVYTMMIVDGNCQKKKFGETHIYCGEDKIYEGYISNKKEFKVIMKTLRFY